MTSWAILAETQKKPPPPHSLDFWGFARVPPSAFSAKFQKGNQAGQWLPCFHPPLSLAGGRLPPPPSAAPPTHSCSSGRPSNLARRWVAGGGRAAEGGPHTSRAHIAEPTHTRAAHSRASAAVPAARPRGPSLRATLRTTPPSQAAAAPVSLAAIAARRRVLPDARVT